MPTPKATIVYREPVAAPIDHILIDFDHELLSNLILRPNVDRISIVDTYDRHAVIVTLDALPILIDNLIKLKDALHYDHKKNLEGRERDSRPAED